MITARVCLNVLFLWLGARDLLQMEHAILLRAGAIEVTHQGRRFRNHLDPQYRVHFTNNIAFKSASFAPRESNDLKTLTLAIQHYEKLTGEEVHVEESALASALKKTAEGEITVYILLIPPIISLRNLLKWADDGTRRN